MRARLGLAGALGGALLLSACADAAPEADPVLTPGPIPAPSPASASVPPPSATPTPDPPTRPITVAVAGDVHFEGALRDRLDDPTVALAGVSPALAEADVAVVNLETAVGTGGTPDPDKRFTFRAPPTAFAALASAGVDVATMANNHALDYGRELLDETFAAIGSAGVHVVGIGRDVTEAFGPASLDVDGTTVAVLGATQASLDPTADPTGDWAATETRPGTADAVDPDLLLRAVAAADREASVVVVYLHWGVQGASCPTAQQRRLAERLVARGADVVVGSHAHVVQGQDRVGQGYVAWGLGNYAWYQPSDTGVLTLTVQPPAGPEGRATVTGTAWEPARIGSDGLPVVTGPAGKPPAPAC